MKARAVATLTAVALALALSGCSDDDSGGNGVPASDDLVQILREGGMEAEMAECMGAAYQAAGFTADELRDVSGAVPDANSEKYRRFAEEVRACTPSDISVPAG